MLRLPIISGASSSYYNCHSYVKNQKVIIINTNNEYGRNIKFPVGLLYAITQKRK